MHAKHTQKPDTTSSTFAVCDKDGKPKGCLTLLDPRGVGVPMVVQEPNWPIASFEVRDMDGSLMARCTVTDKKLSACSVEKGYTLDQVMQVLFDAIRRKMS